MPLKQNGNKPEAGYIKVILYNLYCAVSGNGGGFLQHKREYHERRSTLERKLLDEARSRQRLFTDNVCPACGKRSNGRAQFTSPIGFTFTMCPNDGTIYMDPVPTEETLSRLYNDPAESFSFVGDLPTENMKVKPRISDLDDYRAVWRLINRPSERLKLLDVGCSTGSFLIAARESFDVEGVELNDATASVARAQGFKVMTGRIQDMPGEEVFSVITMLQVLEHIVKPEIQLREAFRLLKPGGYVYVNLPNIDSSSFQYLGHRHMHVSGFGHVSLFNKKSLALLAERCRFEMAAHEYCGGRDLDLHDAVTLALAPKRFHHRMALYSPRMLFACNFIDKVTFDLLGKLIFPDGNESYQRALFKKPGVGKSHESQSMRK